MIDDLYNESDIFWWMFQNAKCSRIHYDICMSNVVELRKRIRLRVKFLRIILQSGNNGVVNGNFQYGIRSPMECSIESCILT